MDWWDFDIYCWRNKNHRHVITDTDNDPLFRGVRTIFFRHKPGQPDIENIPAFVKAVYISTMI